MKNHAADHDELCVPPALSAGLNRLEKRHSPSWEAEDRVLLAIRGSNAGRGRRAGWAVGLTAAAAGLAISAIVWVGRPSAPPAGLGSDRSVAGGGSVFPEPGSPVTMLDAFRLRLMLDGDRVPPTAWDADSDGKVTASDVDAIAAAAVRLGEASS